LRVADPDTRESVLVKLVDAPGSTSPSLCTVLPPGLSPNHITASLFKHQHPLAEPQALPSPIPAPSLGTGPPRGFSTLAPPAYPGKVGSSCCSANSRSFPPSPGGWLHCRTMRPGGLTNPISEAPCRRSPEPAALLLHGLGDQHRRGTAQLRAESTDCPSFFF
jgi:hypothetical protein